MKLAKQIFDFLTETVSGVWMGWVSLGLMVLMLVEVIARYVFNHSLGIADAVAGYFLMTIAYIGLAYTWRRNRHIKISVLTSRMPVRVRTRLRVVILAIATAVVPVLIYSIYQVMRSVTLLKLKSETFLRVPLQWPQLVILIGLVLFFLVIVVDLVKSINALRAENRNPAKTKAASSGGAR